MEKVPIYSRGVHPLYMIIESNMDVDALGLLSMSSDHDCAITFYDISRAVSAMKTEEKDRYEIDCEALLDQKNKIQFSLAKTGVEPGVPENSNLLGWSIDELTSLIGSSDYFLANYHHILKWVSRPDF